MRKMPDIADAIVSLRPGAEWSCGPTYDTLVWLDAIQTPPTQQEVETELQRLLQVYQNTEYQRLRIKAYPTLEDQMDTLFHLGYDGWKASIQAIKDQYPKPTE